MLTAEADYREEAHFMKKAGEQFAEEDQIIIPRVWNKYSTARVLTMDYLPGVHLKEFLASGPDQKQRDHYGSLISRAFLRIWFRNRTLYTDLNPGNFLFMDKGRLGMIDFGSQRTFSDDQWKAQTRHEKATLERDDRAITTGIAKFSLFEKVSDMEPGRLEFIRSLGSWQAEPVMKDNPFDFGSEEFFERGIELYAESMRRGYSRYESVYNWWSRAIIGHRTLMYRLRSRVDYRKIYLEERRALTARDKLEIANYE
jgi:predicted unusual protein kinase regulating ubiquinone biosynthesis (AarF/ABC1/UbiB family)